MKNWVIMGMLVIVVFCVMNWLEIYHKEVVETRIYPEVMETRAQQARVGTWGIDIRDNPLFWGD